MTEDPFRHHPGLRDKIQDPLQSIFRTFEPSQMDEELAAKGIGPGWRYPDELREEMRNAALAPWRGQDLWVFAYGSLIWNPGFLFTEVRRAFLPSHARRFILVETLGGRGTEERPGLIAALDRGPGCHGLAFRIAADRAEAESRVIWNREMLMPGYHAEFLPVETDFGTVTALALTADHDADWVKPDLPHERQVEYAATGEGELGTSLEYVANLVAHFREMKLDDPDLMRLYTDACAYRDRGT